MKERGIEVIPGSVRIQDNASTLCACHFVDAQ